MEQDDKQFPAIFLVAEPKDAEAPHVSNASWEAVAIELAKYYQVFLLMPFFDSATKELYATKVNTDNNYIGLKIIIKRSSFSFMNKVRLLKAYFAADKIYAETVSQTDAVIFLGIHSFSFKMKTEKFSDIPKLLIESKMQTMLPDRNSRKNRAAIKYYYFLSDETSSYYKGVIPDNIDSEVISPPALVNFFGEKKPEENTMLFVVDYKNDKPLESLLRHINNILVNYPHKKVLISAHNKAEAFINKRIDGVTFIKDNSNYKEAVGATGQIVIAGEYHSAFTTILEIIALGKPVLLLTDHIPDSFPFVGYCSFYNELEWMLKADIMDSFIRQGDEIKEDIDELISDNHSPEIMAFAIKQKVDSLLEINQQEHE